MKSQRSYGRSRKGPRIGGVASSMYRHGGMGGGDAYDSDYESKQNTVHADYPKFQAITNGIFPLDEKTTHLLAQVSGESSPARGKR